MKKLILVQYFCSEHYHKVIKTIFYFFQILISNNLCLAAIQSTSEVRQPNANFLEVLIRKCFTVQDENADITYNPNNIVEDLNQQAGVPLFNPSNNGLKINSKVFSNLLINCLKSNVDKVTSNKNVQEHFSKIITNREDELSTVLNVLLYGREISLQDIEHLLNARNRNRSKRDAQNPLNIIQDLLLNLVIEPIKSNLNRVLDSVRTALESLIVRPENIHNPIQGIIVQSTNSAINTAINLISNIQTQLNALLDSTKSASNSATQPNALERSKTRELAFPFDMISNMLETTIVGPVRTTINKILVTLNTTIYSFYTTASNDNPVQGVLNNVINESVTSIVQVINSIYAQVNTILNGISGANFSTTT